MDGKIDIEVYKGRIIALWLGCKDLPFEVHNIDKNRYESLIKAQPSEPSLIEDIFIVFKEAKSDNS